MSTARNGAPHSYVVHTSATLLSWIKQLHEQGASQGEGKRYIAALRTIYHRLQTEPDQFGEPLYHLPAIQLQIRQGVLAPLVVSYGVHEKKRLVFLRTVQMLS